MPPSQSRQRGRFRRLLWIASGVALAGVLSWWAGRSLGHLLYEEDPLEQADAIFMLGGRWLDRAAEAGDLYLEGRAPLVVLSREIPDGAEHNLRMRGIPVPGVTDIQVEALTKMGVPRTAIHVIDEPQLATATEAAALRTLAAARGWRRVIVVTSKLHTARAGLVFRRRLSDLNVEIIMRASRYDATDPARWWQHRVTLRGSIFEAQSLFLYWIGLAD